MVETTEEALRRALTELRDWHKAEYQSNQWINARVEAALALPVTPSRVEYRVRQVLNPPTMSLVEALDCAKRNGWDVESCSIGPWLPYQGDAE